MPVVIAGGVRDGDEIGVLRLARDAADAGAIGLTLGRSVWGASDPERLARALVRVVHDGASVADAQDILQARELCGSRRSTSLVCEIHQRATSWSDVRSLQTSDWERGKHGSDQPLLLGIDIATAGCTSLVIDQDGRERARASVEYGYRSPRRVGPSKMQTSGGRRLHDCPCLCRPARRSARHHRRCIDSISRRSCPSIATVKPERPGSVARSADSTASGAATRATR